MRDAGTGRSFVGSWTWLYVATAAALAVIGSAWLDLTRDHLATPAPPLASGVAIVLAQAAPLAFAQRRALTALAVSLAATAALILVGFPGGPSGVAPLLILLVVAARAQTGPAIAALLSTWGVLAVTTLVRPHLVGPAVVVANVAATSLFFFAGVGTRLARERREADAAREAAAVASRVATSRAESLARRLELARELHDSLGHTLTVALVQARAALDRSDPRQRIAALQAIEQLCAGSLQDLQRLVESLRDQATTQVSEPMLNRFSIAAFTRAVAPAGVDLKWDIDRDAQRIPPELAKCAWRLLQEAVTNALRHGHANRIEVSLRCVDNRLHILVSDNGLQLHSAPGARSTKEGAGLLGMRERVTALGGHLCAGPQAEGGFRVTAELPLDSGSGR